MVKEKTLNDVVMFFIQAVSMPLSEKDFRTLDISLFDFFKRRRFPDVFRVMLICLIYRSLPVAFPQYATELREFLERVFNHTYNINKVEGKPTEEVVREFDEMIDMNVEHPFMKMAIHVAGIYQPTPVTAKDAEKLNRRLELMYANFSTLSEGVRITKEES